MVNQQQVVPAPLNYRGFPRSICTSVNHVVCHGIPADKKLKNGDIINIDITVIKDGYHGDTSRMFMVGKPTIQGERISRIAYECMKIGIEMIRPGIRLGDIGNAIQQLMRKKTIAVSCANTAVTVSARYSTKIRRYCITANPAPGWCSSRV